MPKLSYAQEVAALEETLAAVRKHAEVLPPLALARADELEAQIAEIKRLKQQQRFYGMERKIATEALGATISRGRVYARSIRDCAAFWYGRKDARVVGLGIRLRRRPRRRSGDPAAVAADRLGQVEEASAASRDAACTAHAARANVGAVGADVQEVGGKAAWRGGNAAVLGGNDLSEGAEGQPGGALASEGRGKALELRANAQEVGGNLTAAA